MTTDGRADNTTRRFEGQVAVVTAGGSGIGAAAARRLAQEGCSVVLLDLSGTRAQAVHDEIEAAGGRVRYMKGDVSSEETVQSAIQCALDNFGRLDIMFNNAGLADPERLEDTSADRWDRVIGVTLNSTFYGIKHAVPVMRKQGGGAIVNTGSIDGFMADPRMGSYCAAKAGVVNLTRAAALENARDGIRVNCVCPGSVNTRVAHVLAKGQEDEFRRVTGSVQPLGRIAEAEEIAAAVLWLASRDSSYVNGAILVVDGGLTAYTGLPVFPPAPVSFGASVTA